jgi:hypothetical protein
MIVIASLYAGLFYLCCKNTMFVVLWWRCAWPIFVLSITTKTKTNAMTTIKTNIWNIEVGDIISFTNNTGYKVSITVNRVEEKSWYALGRNSYGTLQSYSKYPDFKITKSNSQPAL